jgi:hypothetical protein
MVSTASTGGPFHTPSETELREALAEEARRRPASLHEQPRYALTTYIVDPIAVPMLHANMQDFIERLDKRFRLRFDDSDFRSLPSAGEPNHAELMRLAAERNNPWRFKDGMLRLEAPPRHTPVLSVSITYESFAAAVIGSTTESTWVAQQVAEQLWAATGAERKWSEFSNAVQRIGYKTTTKVRLGTVVENFFVPEFRDFITQHIEASGSLGTRMGAQPFDKERAEAVTTDTLIRVDIHRIEMRVSQFNKISGRSEECELVLDVGVRDDARRGVITFTSELDSLAHTELITKLRDALSSP